MSALATTPSKIVCVGKNYVAHAAEMGGSVPETPLIFFKPPSSLIDSGEAIVLPTQSEHVEYEGEVALIIGRRTRNVSEDEALGAISHVLVLNDVTARDLQRSDGQWTRAKGFDTFCAVGTPVAIEALDRPLDELEVRTLLNGEQRQHGRVRDMAFSIPFLISWISQAMTLEPGDIVSTGTPEGVGRLNPGDTVRVEIPGVGAIENPVIGL